MTLALDAVLDTSAAAPLRLALKKAVGIGEPLLIDGRAVERIGQACLQVLLAARASAATLGLGFRIEAPSAPLADMAALAGLSDLVLA